MSDTALTDLPTVTAADLNRRFGEVQASLDDTPIIVTHHGKPRVAMLSIEEFERLRASSDDRMRQGELALRRKLMHILDSISEGYVSVDRDWRLVTVNRAAELFIGLSRDQLVGRSWTEAFPDADIAEGLVRRALDGGEAVRTEIASSLHPSRRVALTTFPLSLPDRGAGILFTNITERTRIDAQLSALKSQQVHLMGLIDDVAFLEADDGRIVAASRGAERFLQRSGSEIKGATLETIGICSDGSDGMATLQSTHSKQSPLRETQQFLHHNDKALIARLRLFVQVEGD